MADDPKKAVDKMKAAAELGPIIEGVESIAEHVKARDDVFKETTEKIEKNVTDLRSDVEKGFKSTLERIESVSKQGTKDLLSRLSIDGGDDDLMQVVPKHYKNNSALFEHCAQYMKSEKLQNVKLYMAANRWFECTAKAGLSKFAADHSRLSEEAGKIASALNTVSKAALQEDIPGEGGNLVPTLVAAEINRLIMDAGEIFPRARQVALMTKTTQFPAEKTAVTVNWITEETSITQGEPTFSQITVQADKLAGRAKFSIELLQDSAPTLLQYLLEVFTEKMAGELDFQLILGDGTAPELLGIVNDAGLVRNTLSTNAALVWSRIPTAFTSAGEKSARVNGIWVMSPRGYAEILGLSDDNNMPIIHFGTATREAPAGSILGRPIVVSARLGGGGNLDDSTNDKTKVLFGPPTALIAGTRQGMTWDVTDALGWANYQMDARLVGRFGGRPVVGASWASLEDISVPAFT